MKGSAGTLFSLLILLLVSFGSSQITFSRSWVRGKYPGEGELVGDNESSAFLRDAKAEVPTRDDLVYTRVPKAPLPVSLNSRLFQDLLRKWKSPYFNRYKEFTIPVE